MGHTRDVSRPSAAVPAPLRARIEQTALIPKNQLFRLGTIHQNGSDFGDTELASSLHIHRKLDFSILQVAWQRRNVPLVYELVVEFS